MKFALRRREGELTALLSTAVSTGPIYPRLGNYVGCHLWSLRKEGGFYQEERWEEK